MDLRTYIIFILILGVCAVFSGYASRKVHTTYEAFGAVENRSRLTGYDTATRLLRRNDVRDVAVERVRGRLTDHYNPRKELVNLSESTFGESSVAAVAVAAHEIGHVMQKKKGYLPYKIRAALVPVANFLALTAYVGGNSANVINGVISGVISIAVAAVVTFVLCRSDNEKA